MKYYSINNIKELRQVIIDLDRALYYSQFNTFYNYYHAPFQTNIIAKHLEDLIYLCNEGRLYYVTREDYESKKISK